MWSRFAVAAAASALTLAAATAQAEPKQGGEMVVTYKDDISTFDPAIGYDWQNWSMIKSLFDGLMDYKPGTTELIPDLAESYTISDDGLVYTFKLRKGVKFHNGRELVASDIKYSIERAVNPETQSPGQGFFAHIKGFDEMASGAAKELSGITTPDDSHRPDRAVAARCHVPAHRRDQFRLRRAARGGREVRPGLRPQSGGHRRLQDDRVDARPARRVRA